MFVLGIQGSPRKNGNSNYLLSSFLKECEVLGAKTDVINSGALDIRPCKELIVCEKKGFCPIKDEMEIQGYAKLKQADLVVLASPVFFYNVTAQAKVFIDRCQMFWGRKYKLGLKDPDRFTRQGFLLSVAASGGKRLFEGVELTAKYFFDAISAEFSGSLTYKKVEDAGQIIVRPELEQEVKDAVAHLLTPELNKKRQIFVSRNGQCRSLMAAGFAKELSRGRVRGLAAGLEPGDRPDPAMIKAMEACGLDLKYWPVRPLDEVLAAEGELTDRDRLVFMGSPREIQNFDPPPGRLTTWEIPRPDMGDIKSIEAVRDQIRKQVQSLAGF